MTKPATIEPVKAKSLFRGLASDLSAIMGAEQSTVPAEIELLQTGEWDTPWHGKFVIDHAALEEYVQHFNDGVRKGVPIDLEHNSMGGAYGWVDTLEIRANDLGGESLWAKVSWTPAGEQKIKDREYRFFSPEFADEDYQDPESGEYMNNVLIGGGLTNRPLFKGLTAVAASEHNGNSKKSLTANSQQNTIYLTQGSESNNMNLAELLAKAPADLTDEEKAFVVEHKAELTDEQVTTLTEAGVLEAEGGDADGDADEDGNGDEDGNDDDSDGAGDDDGNGDDDGAGDDGNGSGTQANDKNKKANAGLTASEVKQLRADAAAGRAASETLAKKASEEHVATLCFSETNKDGKLPIAAKDQVAEFYHGLNDKQRKAFDGIVAKLPSYKLFGEIAERNSSDAPAGSAQEQVQKKANDLIEADKTNKLTKASAIRKVLASDKTLAKQYNEERDAQRGAK